MPGLDELCSGADVYVQTVLRDDLVGLCARPASPAIDYHSTVEQVARTAAKAKAKVGTLVLTHQIPSPAPGAADKWGGAARRHFAGTTAFGEDLTVI